MTVSVQEANNAIAAETQVDNKFQEELNRAKALAYNLSQEERQVRVSGLAAYYRLRENWSWFITMWVTTLITFNVILTFFVGWGFFKFNGLQWFVSSVAAETFIQIVGLAYIATQYLFSDKESKADDRSKPPA